MLDRNEAQNNGRPNLFEKVFEEMTRVKKKAKLCVRAENVLRGFAVVDDAGK